MGKILVFDDRPQIRDFFIDELSPYEDRLQYCSSIDEADEFLDETVDVDGIILDVIIPTAGLSDDQRKMTKGGALTGWVWLWHHCNPDRVVPHPLSNMPIVIYTAYLEDYMLYIESEQPTEEEKAFASSTLITLISKDDDDNKVIERIKNHFNLH